MFLNVILDIELLIVHGITYDAEYLNLCTASAACHTTGRGDRSIRIEIIRPKLMNPRGLHLAHDIDFSYSIRFHDERHIGKTQILSYPLRKNGLRLIECQACKFDRSRIG